MIMTKTRWLLVGMVCLALWPVAGCAQSAEHPEVERALREVLDAHERYEELYAQGRYQEALPFAEKVVRMNEIIFGPEDPGVAISLVVYAALLRKTGRGDEAAKMEARAEAIRAKHAR